MIPYVLAFAVVVFALILLARQPRPTSQKVKESSTHPNGEPNIQWVHQSINTLWGLQFSLRCEQIDACLFGSSSGQKEAYAARAERFNQLAREMNKFLERHGKHPLVVQATRSRYFEDLCHAEGVLYPLSQSFLKA